MLHTTPAPHLNLSAPKCIFFPLKLQFVRLFVHDGAWGAEALGQAEQGQWHPRGKGHSSPAEGMEGGDPSAGTTQPGIFWL